MTFEAEVPALGYRTYYLETAEQLQNVDVVSGDANVLENDAMKVVVNEDGSYSLLDKKTGRTWVAMKTPGIWAMSIFIFRIPENR